MKTPKKLSFVFGDVAYTFTPADLETVIAGWLAENPGKTERDIPDKEFADRCMDRLLGSAKPTRTVIHN